MTLRSAVARFRRRQASLFVDRARVHRPTGSGTLDTNDGEWTPAAATLIYDGPCLIRGQNWEAAEVTAGGQQASLPHLTGKFPANTDIRRGDVVVVTGSAHDSRMVGLSFVVRDIRWDGWQIAAWYILEETVA